LLGRAVQAVLVRVVHHGDAGQSAAVALGRFVGFVFAAVGLVYGLSVLGVRLAPLVGALSVGGLALALAGQTILANFLGSIILQLRRPFRRGDQVSTNGCEGTVEDVNFRTVVLRTFDGESRGPLRTGVSQPDHQPRHPRPAPHDAFHLGQLHD
jgi:small conductance mechanosensitive channel